jgi:regulator of RNase E activity RraA
MTRDVKYCPTPVLANAAERILGAWSPRSLAIEGLIPVRTTDKAVGPAYTIRLRRARSNSRANAARVLAAYDAAPANSIVVVQVVDDVGGALLGDIIAHRLKKIGVAGVVVDGPVRDLDGLAAFGPAIWYRVAVTTGLEMADTETEVHVSLEIASATIRPGEILVADRDGVVLVPSPEMDAFSAQAEAIVAREETIHDGLEANRSLIDVLNFRDALT